MKHKVESSTIKYIEETGRKTIIIEFKDGRKYEYEGIPLDVVKEFVASPSVGRYFNENIRSQYVGGAIL